MSSSLPTEILEAIVDIVARDGGNDRLRSLLSLCICSRALVPRTQMYIFREVTIYPAEDAILSHPELELSPIYRHTVSLARTVRNRPHLAFHVQTLRCKLTTPLEEEDHAIRVISGAVRAMTNVRELTLGFDPLSMNPSLDSDEMLSYEMIRSNAWNAAIIGILRCHQLERFTIHNVTDYPQVLLPFLLKGTAKHVTVSHSLLHPAPPFARAQTINPIVCRAETLHMTLATHRTLFLIGSIPVLRVLRCLRELTITINAPPILPLSEANIPLKDIHVDSLGTLTRLNIQIDTETVIGHVEIGHPFSWRWDIALRRLQHLRQLKLHFSFHDSTATSVIQKFGVRWAAIPHDLADPGVCPCLTELDILISLRAHRGVPDAEMRKQALQGLIVKLKSAFQYFQSIAAEKFRKQGRAVAVTFEVVTSIGPF